MKQTTNKDDPHGPLGPTARDGLPAIGCAFNFEDINLPSGPPGMISSLYRTGARRGRKLATAHSTTALHLKPA